MTMIDDRNGMASFEPKEDEEKWKPITDFHTIRKSRLLRHLSLSEFWLDP